MKHDKAQVSIEAVAAFIILLLTLVVVYAQAGSFSARTDYLSSARLQKSDCSKLDSGIRLADSAKENASLEMLIGSDANIASGFINMDDYYCETLANVSDSQLLKGKVLVKKEGEVITIENI